MESRAAAGAARKGQMTSKNARSGGGSAAKGGARGGKASGIGKAAGSAERGGGSWNAHGSAAMKAKGAKTLCLYVLLPLMLLAFGIAAITAYTMPPLPMMKKRPKIPTY